MAIDIQSVKVVNGFTFRGATITMTAVERALADLIENEIGKDVDVPEAQLLAISRFLPASNLGILKKALGEVKGVAARKGQTDFVARLHRVYHRKLAEQAALYPTFHILETSYRAFLALWMEESYGTPAWWKEHFDRLNWIKENPGEKAPDSPGHINGHPIPNRVSFAIDNFLKNSLGAELEEKKLIDAGRIGIFDRAILSDLETLIHEQWPNIKSSFPKSFPNGLVVTQNNFNDKFSFVRNARNTSFHHREVPGRAAVVQTAEELLDLIDIHLGTCLEDVRHVTHKALPMTVHRQDRHRNLDAGHEDYYVSYAIQGQDYKSVSVKSTCSGSAMSRFLLSLNTDKLRELADMKAVKVGLGSVEL